MSKLNTPSIKKNFIYSTLYQILTMITPFITAPYISRVLGADGVGIYSYTNSIELYFAMFAAMGVLSYGSREIARKRDNIEQRSKVFFEIEIMVIITTIICLLVWFLVIWFYTEYRIYFLILSFSLISIIFDISWFFTGIEEFKYIVVKNTIVKLTTIVLLFGLIKSKNDLLKYIALMSISTLIGNISMWTQLRKYVCRVDIKILRIKRHFKESFFYFIPTIATSVYTILDKTLIGLITGDNYANGYYEQATKIINMAKAITFTSLNSVMGARISYLFAENRLDEIHHKLEKSLNFIIVVAIGICFGLLGISDRFVLWFFGAGYEPVSTLLCIFSPIIIIIGISNCIGSMYYTPAGLRALSAKFIIAGSGVNLVLNCIMIPYIGVYGAAISSVIAELIITIFYVRFSKSYVSLKLLWKFTWKRIIAGIIMLVILRMICLFNIRDIYITIMQVVIGGLVYTLILIGIKDDIVKEIYMIINRLKKN